MKVILWSIYKITNLLNNKIYIGQTKNIKNRWSRHKSDAKLGKKYNSHLYEAMRKYGTNNFICEIIVQTQNIEDIDALEVICIQQYNSLNRTIGYNISAGGQTNKLVSAETREKLSKSLKGRISPMKGKNLSQETKDLLSLANKGNTYRLGVKVTDKTKQLLSNINKGKKISEDTLKKMSQSMIGKNAGDKNGMFGQKSIHAKLTQNQAIKIRHEYAVGDISMIDLSKKYNVSKKTIFNILHNKIYRE